MPHVVHRIIVQVQYKILEILKSIVSSNKHTYKIDFALKNIKVHAKVLLFLVEKFLVLYDHVIGEGNYLRNISYICGKYVHHMFNILQFNKYLFYIKLRIKII